jgi:hypothetical protein
MSQPNIAFASEKRMDDPPSSTSMLPTPRSQTKIPRDLFALMKDLMTEKPWLTQSGRSSALADLIDIAESLDEQKLILELLERFHFIDQTKIQENLVAIKNQIVGEWHLKPSNTIILGSSDKDYSKSSDMVLYRLKSLFASIGGWPERHFITNIGAASRFNLNEFNIVMVDDFIGSGTDINKKLRWLHDKINENGKKAKIYVCVFAAMKQSKSVLEELCVSYFVNAWLLRGVSDFYQGSALEQAIQLMESLESKLCCKSFGRQRLDKFHFGYKRSETLYHLENGNSPNNVFPIFWWDCQKPNDKRQPLFPRL